MATLPKIALIKRSIENELAKKQSQGVANQIKGVDYWHIDLNHQILKLPKHKQFQLNNF